MRLTVEDDPERFVFIGNRLVATFDVDDREPPHAQTNAWLHVEAVAIWPAVDDGLGHGFHCPWFRDLVIRIGDATNATHKVILPFPTKVHIAAPSTPSC